VGYVLSDEDWQGPTGYVQHNLRSHVDDASTSHFYICGVPEMVVETKGLLFDLGTPEKHIFTEGWEEGAITE
jgi:NAD(P)H-flavin reductase